MIWNRHPTVATMILGLNVRAKDKERTYPDLTGQHGRCHLVVLAGDVSGRWSAENPLHCALTSESSTLHWRHEFDNIPSSVS